jgi:hypothetical protein
MPIGNAAVVIRAREELNRHVQRDIAGVAQGLREENDRLTKLGVTPARGRIRTNPK